MKVNYDAVVPAGAGEWYGTMVVSNLRYDDGSSVQVNQYLSMDFNAPAAIASTDVNVQFVTWVETTVEANSVQLDSNLFSVSLKINMAAPHAMVAGDQITIGVNGDLTQNPDTYLTSFVIAADQSPDVNGTVTVACAVAPDSALASIAPVVKFIRGSQITPVTLAYGKTTNVTLSAGDYRIEGSDVATSDGTVSAPLTISPAQLTVAADSTASVNVSFGTVQRTGALDIAVGSLSGLESETLSITVLDKSSGNTLAAFTSGVNSTTPLRSLPASGTAQIKVDNIALNNTNYVFSVPDVALANKLQTVQIDNSTISKSAVDTTGFANVPINVTADATLPQQVTLRLIGSDMNYMQSIAVETQSTAFSVPVKPGTYTVSAPAFLSSGVVCAVNTPAEYTVGSATPRLKSATLDVSIEKSANLIVPGFPSYLSFGGCADLTPSNQDDFVSARTSSIFTYAGVDGAGDAGTYLTDDPQTTATIDLARNVEAELNGQPVLPVIISYTCNLSLGDTPTMLANADQHAHSFANLIVALNIANASIDSTHAVPAGFIVNPDFLGACQQGEYAPTYAMPVRAPLQTALDHWSIAATIPSSITEDIKGYVAAVNWLLYTVAPKVVFGWQINLWGVGMSEWVYQEDVDPVAMAQQTATYIDSLAAYSGSNKPHFLAIDRYEADDYTQRAYVNGYCYGPREWGRYFDFCEGVSRALKLPVMPWQIPASRTPNTTDQVNADFDSQHWGTGGSYIMGDAAIGSDYHNVNPTILAFQFPTAFPDMGATAEDMYIRSEPFDMTNPAYTDFPLRGIFAVLLGGGSTTGLISAVGNPESWTRDKLSAYMDKPITFGGTPGKLGKLK